jgi:hypothetical protein
LSNEINGADNITISDVDPSPVAEGEDQGVGNERDYYNIDSIGADSFPPHKDENKPVKKDTIINTPAKKTENLITPIGSPAEDPKKKKGKLKNKISNN